ncbi:uncharacterized protein CcaverHIS019_0400330 [Cutaneotrichosporon cavernicola]|uniref:Pep3/Vps18/deep orange domain-containing protein n=1 Tax=Cutaneotrichosporon cavernicola TaxID=279322 RepID=A0AA48L3E1_9TREE|nr:uncharacterized protein CcaverHIS019_0400330 [Cutaneotrichosporon cavernicola]BEI91213.1 hypothetical protein CcaverHIS019_0400330 [Cutaneotrichosporon cavernicola]BEI98986.1 hypothetical protein CcaverHIS631_0400290 [Cutaneotrichosporon cavernicola]BEJ06760.1 hypothetical protein CcaverHIS641_0400290 [Cutaneotrichosporon cavernicola]
MSMLDDFVEHAAGPGRGAVPRPSALAGVEYEGFERDDHADEVSPLVRALETGFVPTARVSATLPPLFSLSTVQYTPPADILFLTAANNVLFFATQPLSVVIIDLNAPDELVTIDLPRPTDKGLRDVTIKALFADPTARHLIITTSTGDAFYLPVAGISSQQNRRPRALRLRQNVTAVAWSPIPSENTDPSSPPPTDVLLGCATGAILSLPLPPSDDIFKVQLPMGKQLERDLQVVYHVEGGETVTGIAFGFWKEKKERSAWAVWTTKDRVFEVQAPVSTTFAGGKGGGWAEEVFRTVRDGVPKFHELPGDPPASELHTFIPSVEGQVAADLPAPTAVAWLTAAGLYYSALSPTPTSEILYQPSLLPYPPAPVVDAPPAATFRRNAPPVTETPVPVPISCAVSEWHWLFLYADRIVAVSRLSEKVVWDEPLPLSSRQKALSLSSDPVSRTFWVSTTQSIIEVVVQKEERDVWRAKLESGKYASALKYAATPAQRDIVLSKQGDALFAEGKHILSARAYAESTRSFEFVTLRFVDADERDALRVYLIGRLDKLDKKDLTQRMMIATWLLEIYLSKCNTLEDLIAAEAATSDVETLHVERDMVEDDLRTFIKDYRANLDPRVVYELILAHGRMDLYLYYAELNKDHDRVVEHWIQEENWTKAIDVLSRQDSLDLYYRFASILMRNVPKQTVNAWERQVALEPRRLIPALLQQRSEPLPTNQAVRYLEHVVFRQASTDSTIYNLLLTLYASDKDPDDAPLLRFLNSCPDDPITERPYYDLDYALRLCKAHGRIQPCVHIYSRMGLYEQSVALALEKGDLELAKINADKPDDDEPLRKKLWLKIAKYVVQEKGDIKSAMKFLESTDLVKIEDILPFFPDFVVIDDFKTEICSALEDYSARIDELKAEMAEATRSAESIKHDIDALSTRFVAVEMSDKCWRCGQGITSRQFYVFPCQHAFHADCLISMAMEYLPSPSLRRILHLQDELVRSDAPGHRLLSSQFSGTSTPRRQETASAADFLLGPGRRVLAAGDRLRELIVPDALAQAVVGGKKNRPQDESRLEAARAELDALVAAVCPLCEGAVAAIDKPFVREGEDAGDWAV